MDNFNCIIAVDVSPPSSPTNLASPSQSPTSITLSWEQPAGDAVDRYDIVYTYQGGCPLQSTSFETTATTEMLTLQNLEEFSGYSVSVTAVNNGGRSAPATGTFTTAPAGKQSHYGDAFIFHCVYKLYGDR